MLFQILKKDMLKRKGINIILFLFITLSTVFLASSISNILVVTSGVDHYLEYAALPDVYLATQTMAEEDQITDWLEDMQGEGKIESYNCDRLISVLDKSIQMKKAGEDLVIIDSRGASLFLGKMNSVSNKVFDRDGKEFSLAPGEIAIPVSVADLNELEIGDELLIENNQITKEYTIKEITKDAAFGNEMVGMNRFVISESDYEEYRLQDGTTQMGIFSIYSDDIPAVTQLIGVQDFKTILNTVTLDMYKLAYSFDMIFAALLILIGICLILIALLVLRFTLMFTMEEQYQEIGILKALGLRNKAIKNIYLIKYLAIVSIGAIIGLCISVPVSKLMVSGISHNIIMASQEANLGVNILSAMAIVVFVLLFCYHCTNKLNKVSAISAIRHGDTGETFSPRHKLSLASKKRMSIPVYLGLNDIFSHLSRYIVLIITFCISFILITIPLNTLNTMNSKEMVEKFSLDTSSAAYIRMIEKPGEPQYTTAQQVKDRLAQMEQEFKAKNYDVSLKAVLIYFTRFYSEGSESKKNILTSQIIGEDNDFLTYSKGTAPILENEIAFSEDTLKNQGWEIGNSIHANFNGKEQTFIITGTYSDYMQLGESARLNPIISTENEMISDYWAVMMDMETTKSQSEMVKEMQSQFPEFEWKTGQELVNQNVGGIQDILADLLMPMTLMLCIIIMLITLLMEKMFIIREKGEIAMLKSIGFTYQAIRNWQVLRVVFVAVTAMIIAVPLSLISNQFILRPIFKIMGASVAIQVNPLQVYLIYPAILLFGIIVATLFTARGIKKIHIREINNIE